MPDFTTDNILVVTYQELVDEGFYKDKKTIASKVSQDMKREWGMKKVRPGKGLEHEALIEFDSLPAHIKHKLEDPRKDINIIERYFKVEKETVDFYTDFRFSNDEPIEDKPRDIYICNASVIQAIYRLKTARMMEWQSKNKKVKKLWQSIADDLPSFKAVLTEKYAMQCTLPENYRRLEPKCENFKEKGLISLISGNHLNTNRQKVDEHTLALFENLFAGQDKKPNFTEVAESYASFIDGYTEIINVKTGEQYNPKDFPKLSDGTVYRYLSMWKSKVGTLAKRSGDEPVLKGKTIPYRSFIPSEFASTIISVDDRQPPFKYDDIHRPWFYLAHDDASGCITTWVHGKTKKGIILEFYRQMVRNYAEWGLPLPAELECESSLNSSFKNTFLRQGTMFEYVHIEPNNPRGKFAENRNRQLRYKVEKDRDGWIPRHHARDEANQKGPKEIPIIPYTTIIQNCLMDIQNNNNMPHRVEKHMTRWEYFLSKQHPKLHPINWNCIIPMLGYKEKTSCNAGIVKLQHAEFLLGEKGEIYTGERLINLMNMVEGQEIFAYWLNGNDGKVLKAFAYIGDNYQCELVAKPKYKRGRKEQNDEDKIAELLFNKYVSTIQGYQNRVKKSIDKVVVINHKEIVLNNKFQIRELAESAQKSDYPKTELLNDINEDELDDEFIEITSRFKRKFEDIF